MSTGWTQNFDAHSQETRKRHETTSRRLPTLALLLLTNPGASFDALFFIGEVTNAQAQHKGRFNGPVFPY